MNISTGECNESDTKEQVDGSRHRTNSRLGRAVLSLPQCAYMEYVSQRSIISGVVLELIGLSWLRKIRPHVESHR